MSFCFDLLHIVLRQKLHVILCDFFYLEVSNSAIYKGLIIFTGIESFWGSFSFSLLQNVHVFWRCADEASGLVGSFGCSSFLALFFFGTRIWVLCSSKFEKSLNFSIFPPFIIARFTTSF